MFNDDQRGYMEYLDSLDPSTLCWCGWYLHGECYNCNRAGITLTAADKLKRRCPLCRNTPVAPNWKLIHIIGCQNTGIDILAPMVCPRCDVDMVEGQALDNSEVEECLYEVMPISQGKLVPCMNCPECGHSEIVDNFSP